MQQRISDSLPINNEITKEVAKSKKKVKKKGKEKKEGMSFAGIGNAAAGTALANTVKNIFTQEHNKPATKGDLLKLANHFNKYVQIKDLEPNILGQKPFLELETGKVVYLFLSIFN